MKAILFALVIGFFASVLSPVRADYVLPYPSFMPGNKLYRVTRIVDTLKAYWHWGNIAKTKYHLGLSDKYLVEAKTLMEYGQYLLATDALTRSDFHFSSLSVYVRGAKERNIDIAKLKSIIGEASVKHRNVLFGLKQMAPAEFIWTPEKQDSSVLKLDELLQGSEEIRVRVAIDVHAL